MDGKQLILPKGYAELLGRLKEQIRNARVKAALSVNREMILLYWDIGLNCREATTGKMGKACHRETGNGYTKGFPRDRRLFS